MLGGCTRGWESRLRRSGGEVRQVRAWTRRSLSAGRVFAVFGLCASVRDMLSTLRDMSGVFVELGKVGICRISEMHEGSIIVKVGSFKLNNAEWEL
jgi:hypothetical protein